MPFAASFHQMAIWSREWKKMMKNDFMKSNHPYRFTQRCCLLHFNNNLKYTEPGYPVLWWISHRKKIVADGSIFCLYVRKREREREKNLRFRGFRVNKYSVTSICQWKYNCCKERPQTLNVFRFVCIRSTRAS